MHLGIYIAKNQYRKFETNIPRKGIAPLQSQFWAIYIFPVSISPLCVCERFIYSHDLPILKNMWTDPGNI